MAPYPRVSGYAILRPWPAGTAGTEAWLARPEAVGGAAAPPATTERDRVLKIVSVATGDRVPRFERAADEVRDAADVFLLSEWGVLPGAVFLASPLLPDCDLSSRLRALESPRALAHLRDFACRLGRYHRRGWVH